MTSSIIPYIWFDGLADAAARFYTAVFPESRYLSKFVIKDTPSGDCDQVTFTLAGQTFMAIDGGPFFTLNPSISFFVNCRSEHQLRTLWHHLIALGEALMPLDAYPFSPLYGWVKDRFGITWQLKVDPESERLHGMIVPSLLFTGQQFGKAVRAIEHYVSVFPESKMGVMQKEADQTLQFGSFRLGDKWFYATESGFNHGFEFNEALSLLILCETQTEIDYFWSKLEHLPETEQCGWIKDFYGLSWQIVPGDFDRKMEEGSESQANGIVQEILEMKKLDMAMIASKYEAIGDKRLSVAVKVEASPEKVWSCFTDPHHIQNWYFASQDWEVTHASNALYVDGNLEIGMAAKDGSMAFDFSGKYMKVDPMRTLIFKLGDQRKVVVTFTSIGEGCEVREIFDPDEMASFERQVQGWQSILNNLKAYVEGAVKN